MSEYHHHYDHYDPTLIERLDGFYGKVEDNIHAVLSSFVAGPNVLDLGCGYGSLTNYLHQKGCLGIDQHEPSIQAGARKFLKCNLKHHSGDLSEFKENNFDTIILKDVIHHIYEEDEPLLFLNSLRRICKKKIIIIDPNPTFILKLARKIIRHVDPECPVSVARSLLEKSGFKITTVKYSEILAFPLSGGYVSFPFVRYDVFGRLILYVDKILLKLLDYLRISKYVCWRYYVVAEKV